MGKGNSDKGNLYFWGQVAKEESSKVLQVTGHFQWVSPSLGAPSGAGQVQLRDLHGSFLGLVLSSILSLPGPWDRFFPAIWSWPHPAGLASGHCHCGWVGEGSPAPTLSLGLGAVQREAWVGAPLGGVGSVQLLRSSAPVLWPVWARAALGAQGWDPR